MQDIPLQQNTEYSSLSQQRCVIHAIQLTSVLNSAVKKIKTVSQLQMSLDSWKLFNSCNPHTAEILPLKLEILSNLWKLNFATARYRHRADIWRRSTSRKACCPMWARNWLSRSSRSQNCVCPRTNASPVLGSESRVAQTGSVLWRVCCFSGWSPVLF